MKNTTETTSTRRRCAITATLVTACLLTSACQPWVKPYQRANLADEIMAFDRDPISDGYMHHVRQSREGARGAEGSGGGGCGCN